MALHSFGLLDWAILGVYAAVLLGIAWHYSRRQRTAEEYFVGGRRMHPLLAGVSVFAALFSVISYIGTPGEYVQYGPVLSVGVALASLPFLQLGVGWILIPAIMRLPITSAYELFEARLGRPVRRLGAGIFVVSRMVSMSLILYTGTILLVQVAGCGPGWEAPITILTGGVTIAYTLAGGIRTVIITEVVQFFILLLGAILTIVSISVRLGGVSAWWPVHRESHWPPTPFFSLDPHIRLTIAGAFVSQLIWQFCAAGSDQASVQRFLTLRDVAAARRAYLVRNAAAGATGILLALAGAALLGVFRRYPGAIPAHLSLATDGDAFFPLYISHYLPAGVAGLVVAGIMAAAMSGFSSGASAVVTVVARDFIETSRPEDSQAGRVRLARWLTLAVGAVAVAGSLAVGLVRGNLIEVTGRTVNLLICPLFGLFFLAVFTRFSTPFGAVFGVIYSTAAAALIAYWDVFTGQPKLSFIWVAPVSLAVSLGAGCLFSLLPTRGRSSAAIAAYSAAALALLFAAVGCLLNARLAR